MENAILWLLATLLCVIIHAFFSMQEMAAVSFSKVRLQYDVNRGHQRALWLNTLLKHPARLFGTTLIVVNTMLQIGSECSRQFYSAINLNPDFAPASQVLLVLVFAELSPMIAARRYPEHVAMLGVPIIYATSKLVTPFIWGIGILTHWINRLIGNRDIEAGLFLSREELQHILEEQEEGRPEEPEDVQKVVSNILSIKDKTAKDLMDPLSVIQMIPSNCTVGRMRQILEYADYPSLPIYHRSSANIVSIAFPRDFLRIPDNQRVRDHARPPWFITATTKVSQILTQFRRNNQSVAIVLDHRGVAVGALTLDAILNHIFGTGDYPLRTVRKRPHAERQVVERTFPGTMRVDDFNEQFNADLEGDEAETLSQLMVRQMGHLPAVGETVRIGSYELTADKVTLFGIKRVAVKTL